MIKKTFVTLFATVFAVSLALFATVLIGAACSEKVTLRFETNGGTYLASVEGNVGASFTAPEEPEKEGYYFDGWYLTPDFSGSAQQLPEVMPSESVTYYAKYGKYPALTLDPMGGSLEKREHFVKPGTPLKEYLSGYVPEKSGLLFGGWMSDGEALKEDAIMPEGDLALSARYKATYAVNVFLQDADEPDKYKICEQLSYTGTDWEGATVTPGVETPAHFLPSGDSSAELVLGAGLNAANFFFTREAAALKYVYCSPLGGEGEKTVDSRYGASAVIEESPFALEGYAFFGWSHSEGGEADPAYAPGAQVTLEGDVTLYGAWAQTYTSAYDGAVLAVALHGENGVRRAVYTAEDGTVKEGIFENGVFDLGDLRGKLDGKGNFLLDDSGKYLAADLTEAGICEGSLTLDFFEGTATLEQGGQTTAGSYFYVYDEAQEKYTGQYRFSDAEGGFAFLLDRHAQTFLKEGAEKGSYVRYDCMEDIFFEGEGLVLDGFGGAELTDGDGTLFGSYRGGAGEWEFRADGKVFCFRLGSRKWYDGDRIFDAEEGYLRFESDRAGRFVSEEGTLLLDGYGLNAVLERGEETVHAPFVKRGAFVTLLLEEPITFTLTEAGFARTGEEAGAYEGVRGELFLDGAGGATLKDGETVLFAGYSSVGGDYLLEGEEGFRFRLTEKGYEIYEESLSGEYSAFYGVCLTLDGYGGGFYRSYLGENVPIEVGYFDDSLIEIRSPDFLTPTGSLVFALEGRAAEQILRAEAGSYRLREGEEWREEYLFLDGRDLAVRYGGVGERGEYSFDPALGEIVYTSESGSATFRLGKKGSAAAFERYDGAGSYTGPKGELVLDGYGNASFGGGEFRYTKRGDTVELMGEKLCLFTLSEDSYTFKAFTRYHFEGEELYLEEGGTCALWRGEQDRFGVCEWGEIVTLSFEERFSVRIYGEFAYRYTAPERGEYAIEGGGTLTPDGCGFARLHRGGQEYFGALLAEEGYLSFVSEEVGTVSGCLGFSVGESGTLTVLGEEFGSYVCSQNEEVLLTLYGNGTACMRTGSGCRFGSYTPVEGREGEFLFVEYGARLRFCIAREDDRAVYTAYLEALSPYEGSFEGEEGPLFVSGYQILLSGEEYSFVRGVEGGMIVRDFQGELRLILLAEGNYTLSHVGSSFEVT